MVFVVILLYFIFFVAPSILFLFSLHTKRNLIYTFILVLFYKFCVVIIFYAHIASNLNTA